MPQVPTAVLFRLTRRLLQIYRGGFGQSVWWSREAYGPKSLRSRGDGWYLVYYTCNPLPLVLELRSAYLKLFLTRAP